MDFLEVIKQARAALQSEGRITYRTLKRQFALDDEALEDLKFELIKGQKLAVDEEGDVLVWAGAGPPPATPSNGPPQAQTPSPPPASYTPHHLAERILAEQAAMESRGSANGERKTITALFADLKGSTALIEGLDPEDARAIIDPALQLMMDAVHRYDGYVAQALGDGIFALFGAPIAHEDHPQRALYAALRMQEEMRGYADTLREQGRPPLLMRVGLNTGEVVVRSIRKDDLHADYVPVGHSTNLAARMEQLAAPGSIVVTAYIHKLTDGYFEFKDLGQTQIKGVEEPLNVYEVLGAGPLRTRFQVTARRGLTRFVGRRSELDQLQRALEQAKAGQGQIVGVMGEPGQGKSRLFYEFKLTSQSGGLVLEAFSMSHGKASPYLPLIELLKHYFEIDPTDDERKRREKVTGKVLALDRSLEDTLPYLFALLGIDDPDSSLQQMDAQIRRQRTFDALKQLFLLESLNQPLIFIFEDLHWVDSETQGFLYTLSESVASANVLLLVNYRPEYRHDWGTKTYYTQLRLAPLGKAEAEELLTFLLGSDTSLSSLKPLILEKTEGTPFFIEEVVQTFVEEGVLAGERGHYRVETTPTELRISSTVQGVLAARIDRLAPDEKELLQQLAVIGRQFPVSLVKHVVAQSEPDLHRLLSSLQAKEFLYEQPAFPEVEYLFKHALTQEVAYGTVLQERRRALHERTAEALERLYTEKLADHYTELAHHYSRSPNQEKAVTYLTLAGQQAHQRSANSDAIHALTSALELLRALPDAPERIPQELTVQLTLGVALMETHGYAAPEVERCYLRARELNEQLAQPSQSFPILFGLWVFYVIGAAYRRAYEMGEQLLRVADHSQDPKSLLIARHTLGETQLLRGELRAAEHYFAQFRPLEEPIAKRLADAAQYAFDMQIGSQCWSGFTSWYLGYPDQAVKQFEQALADSSQVGHPPTLAQTLALFAWLSQLRRDTPSVVDYAVSAISVCEEVGNPLFHTLAIVLRAWGQTEQGAVPLGLEQMQQGIATWKSIGARVIHPYLLALFAETYGRTGQPEHAQRILAEAFAVVETTEERLYEAELHRLKGELMMQAGEAEACFHTALEISRQQSAKSWELRAATSLARLWQQQGNKQDAYDLLAPVYDWFTEGFDTADLKDAKALLKKLS